MRTDFTPAVARALEAAQQEARQRGAADVQPLHLLHGLLREAEGLAAALLARAGLDLAGFQGAPAAPTPPRRGEAPLPLHPHTEETLQRAREIAGDVSAERTVSSDHLLLALVRGGGSLSKHLESIGVSTARLEQEIAAPTPALRLEEPLDLGEPTAFLDRARILDAGANRACEALRVLEDYCRFALDDAFLSRTLKELRHDLSAALAGIGEETRLEARETLRDVGTDLSTPQEGRRHSLVQVARVNCRRLQEALRSLEEYGKLHSAELGRALESIRYRSYTLERALLLGTSARRRLAEARLYVLLTGAQCRAALDWTIQEAAAGGAQVFQLREKDLTDRDLLERARNVRRWTRQAGALFIMNDRPDLARLVEADGVHVGQDELPVKEVRRILGPDRLVGVSTHDLGQLHRAVLDGASYVGVGPTFPSGTKAFDEFPGLEFVRRAAAVTTLPAFVIGGVGPDNVEAAVEAGARRVAVSQAVCQSDDPRAAAAALRRVLDAVPLPPVPED